MSLLTVDRRRALLAKLTDAETPEAEVWSLRTQYLEGLPRPEVSRCPLSNAVVTRSIDTFGLDGPWWDVDDDLRPRETAPPTLWAFSGALALGPQVETTDFLVKPGPAVPFVVEHLIRHPAIRAVVSTVRVGQHTGYVIAYFADEGPLHLARVNDWGAPNYWYDDGSGRWADSVTEGDQEALFDLAPWIADGKLQWIEPGDSTLRLRGEVSGCPYLGLEGTRELQRIRSGRVWVPTTVDAIGEEPTGPTAPAAPAAPAAPTKRTRRGRAAASEPGQASGSTSTNPPE